MTKVAAQILPNSPPLPASRDARAVRLLRRHCWCGPQVAMGNAA